MNEIEFEAAIGKVLFRTTKDGQEVQILLTGVCLSGPSRDKLLGLQAAGCALTVKADRKPDLQLSIGEVLNRATLDGSAARLLDPNEEILHT